MNNVLEDILRARRADIEIRKQQKPAAELERLAAVAPAPRSLRAALAAASPIGAIAELKQASPSRGLLRPDFSVVDLAHEYAAGGASALSVLTEPEFFLGAMEFLSMAREISRLPVLCKDFIFDPWQLLDARAHFADAVLLIVAALDDAQLAALYSRAAELGMECLVEVHNAGELERAARAGCAIIGVNNRDLKTMKVSLETSLELAEKFPSGAFRVSESGIKTADDVRRLVSAGYGGILVGEALVTSPDPGAALRRLLEI